MRALDRWLQRRRIARARPWIRDGARLLDVGCFDRSLIDGVASRVSEAIGIDPLLEPEEAGKVRLLRGCFPDDVEFPQESFDCITMLAVLEHVTDPDALAAACYRTLDGGGRVVITVPHAVVDRIIDLLCALRIVDGMSQEEHHGFVAASTPGIFEAAGFRCLHRERFQLGLNNLYVFEKPSEATAERALAGSSRGGP